MVNTMSKIATGHASGKIILIGEHSAVYAKPAIALACNAVQAITTITPSSKGLYIYCDLFQGMIDDMPELLSSLQTVIHETLRYLEQANCGLHIKIDSTIPLERGMGSSAAVSISVIKALFQFFKKTPSDQELFYLSEISEKMVHGNPSGLDASTIISQQAMWFQKGQIAKPFSIELNQFLVIADSGITGQTKKAIEKIANLQQTHPALHQKLIDQLETLTYATKTAIEHKDIDSLGHIFNQAHETLQLLGVSHPFVDELVATAIQNGAIGAKMTGGGLGGCLFALCQTKLDAEKIADALDQQGAIKTYIQSI